MRGSPILIRAPFLNPFLIILDKRDPKAFQERGNGNHDSEKPPKEFQEWGNGSHDSEEDSRSGEEYKGG